MSTHTPVRGWNRGTLQPCRQTGTRDSGSSTIDKASWLVDNLSSIIHSPDLAGTLVYDPSPFGISLKKEGWLITDLSSITSVPNHVHRELLLRENRLLRSYMDARLVTSRTLRDRSPPVQHPESSSYTGTSSLDPADDTRSPGAMQRNFTTLSGMLNGSWTYISAHTQDTCLIISKIDRLPTRRLPDVEVLPDASTQRLARVALLRTE